MEKDIIPPPQLLLNSMNCYLIQVSKFLKFFTVFFNIFIVQTSHGAGPEEEDGSTHSSHRNQ